MEIRFKLSTSKICIAMKFKRHALFYCQDVYVPKINHVMTQIWRVTRFGR